MKRCTLPLLLASLVAAPSISLAQEAVDGTEDWALTQSEDGKMVAAVAAFTNGVTLIARCQEGVYDVMLSGLQPAQAGERTRQLIFLLGDEENATEGAWSVGAQPNMAFSRAPAPLARRLAEGGKLQIVVPPTQGGRRLKYIMDLGPSGEALEQTLTACGRPLQDPRDQRLTGDGGDGLPEGLTWIRPPRPQFPEAVRGLVPENGYATFSCATQADGTLSDCQVEAEHPKGFNLSESVLPALRRARVGYSAEARAAGITPEGGVILFSVVFQLQD